MERISGCGGGWVRIVGVSLPTGGCLGRSGCLFD